MRKYTETLLVRSRGGLLMTGTAIERRQGRVAQRRASSELTTAMVNREADEGSVSAHLFWPGRKSMIARQIAIPCEVGRKYRKPHALW